jgi:YVTN family beta-propeller protein
MDEVHHEGVYKKELYTMQRFFQVSLVLALFVLMNILTGCGGGSGGNNTAGNWQNGTASFVVTWPAPTKIIPQLAESITITVNGVTQTTQRPTGTNVTTLNFSNLTISAHTYQAIAYTTANAAGTPVGIANGSVSVNANETTTVNLTTAMTSTIDHLTITPSNPSVSVGLTTPLTATAYDTSGNVVMVAPGNITWVSANTAVATVNSTSGIVTGVGVGSTTITATESESGKQGTANLRVQLVPGGTVIATVTMYGASGLVVNPTTNMIYACNSSINTLSVIDGSVNTVIATVPVGVYPWGVAVNPSTNRVYVSNFGLGTGVSTVSVLDGNTNTIIATVPVGDYARGVAVNPITNSVYVCNSSNNGTVNTLSVIDGGTNSVIDTVPVGVAGGYAIAVNPTTNKVYFADSDSNSGSMSVLDGSTNTVIATVPVGFDPMAIAVNTITNMVYISNFASNSVSVLDGSTNTVIATVPVGVNPSGVAVNPTTNLIYVSSNSGMMNVLDGSTNSIIATVPVGGGVKIAVNPTTNMVYVSGGKLSVIQGY